MRYPSALDEARVTAVTQTLDRLLSEVDKSRGLLVDARNAHLRLLGEIGVLRAEFDGLTMELERLRWRIKTEVDSMKQPFQ